MIDADLFDEQPDHYSDDEWVAYKRGWHAAMALISSAAEQSATGVMETIDDGDDEPEECDECGAELADGLGGDKVCLRCD